LLALNVINGLAADSRKACHLKERPRASRSGDGARLGRRDEEHSEQENRSERSDFQKPLHIFFHDHKAGPAGQMLLMGTNPRII
jgi:hypothetical protein